MNESIKDKTDWTLIFLWEFGKRYGMDMRQAFNYLKRNKAIAFIKRNYSYVHTQSFASMVTDMAEYCQRQGGELPSRISSGPNTRFPNLRAYERDNGNENRHGEPSGHHVHGKTPGMSMEEMLNTIFNSDTYRKLMNSDTHLYHQGTGYVYAFLEEELSLLETHLAMPKSAGRFISTLFYK